MRSVKTEPHWLHAVNEWSPLKEKAVTVVMKVFQSLPFKGEKEEMRKPIIVDDSVIGFIDRYQTTDNRPVFEGQTVDGIVIGDFYPNSDFTRCASGEMFRGNILYDLILEHYCQHNPEAFKVAFR